MINTSSANKRIAKNTLIVYFRLLIVTIIGLLTSRFVLQALGVSDYGLYNVLGGIIALFAFIAASLSSTTIRFLNIEIGKENGDPNNIFNICQLIHIAFALIILLICETLGMFYIWNYLKVEPDKISDAIFVFQVSTVVACIGIINVPYQSVLIAKEKFVHIALIDIFNAIIKLVLVFLLIYYKGNALRLYALFMSVTTFISFIIYHLLCYKYWPSLVKWKICSSWVQYKKVLVYNNYNLLSTISRVIKNQGSTMLINFFFGTIVNGAYAIAVTVQGFVENFMSNFDTAAAPQIVQNVGSGNIERSISIVNKICKLCIIMTMVVIFPLYVETDYLLSIWLGEVPDGSPTFCRILLIVVLVASTSAGMGQLINASYKIKWFKIEMSICYLLCIPLGYLFYYFGAPAYTILILFVASDLLNRIIQLILMRTILKFDSLTFVKQAYIKPFIIFVIMFVFVNIYSNIGLDKSWEKIFGIFLTLIATLLLSFFIGFNRIERVQLISKIKQMIKHK